MGYHHRRYRRMRGGYGIPFVFPFLMFFAFRSVGAFVAALVLSVIVMLVIRAVMTMAAANNGMNGMGYRQSYYQPPNQQAQPYYQPTYQQPPVPQYQPYAQGYQATPETYREGAQSDPEPKSPSQYEQYEQPQAQYPEQMPPMQQ